jgi:hypothetical protein
MQYVTKKNTDFTVETILYNSKYRPGFLGQWRGQLQTTFSTAYFVALSQGFPGISFTDF